MIRAKRLFVTIATVMTLSACGGGTTAPPAKTTAVIKVGTQGTLGTGVLLKGVGVLVTLPKGVTVATDSSGNVGGSVAIVSGVASAGSVATTYTPATATVNATLKVIVAAGATLFGTGEFITVSCILPAGNTLQASDFTAAILSNLEPADQSLAPVAGLTPTITAFFTD